MHELSQYEVLNKIGSGAFGDVYKIINRSANEINAAKVFINKPSSKSENMTRYLRREVDIISQISYPSILKFIHFSPVNFQNEPKPVIITEFLPNGTLQDIITYHNSRRNDNYWNDTRKLINIYGIASAMSFLHSQNIVHRDLKPENILMDDFLCPKIADFGLSKVINHDIYSLGSSSDPDIKGTSLYIAPEILTNYEYSEKSDVYAFSMIVYEIMTNEKPFKNIGNICTIWNKVNSKERPEFSFPIPQAYKTLIEKCWSHDPEKRPSFSQIVEQLRTDSGFITEKINVEDYQSYVAFLNQEINEPNGYQPIKRFINHETDVFKVITINEQTIHPEEVEIIFQKGKKYENGIDVPIDKNEAARCYKKCADNGHLEAMFKYGWMKSNENGLPIDKEIASFYFKKAADRGHIEAMFNYAWLLSQDNGTPFNQVESCRYYEMAANKGHVNAMNNYAVKLLNGSGVPVNKILASKYFKRAADKGHVKAMYNYAWMSNKGVGIPVNLKEANKYYKNAANKGDVNSMINYSWMLDKGFGGDENKKESNKYYQMAYPIHEKKEWHILESLEDFTISDSIIKKPYIKKGIINSTMQLLQNLQITKVLKN